MYDLAAPTIKRKQVKKNKSAQKSWQLEFSLRSRSPLLLLTVRSSLRPLFNPQRLLAAPGWPFWLPKGSWQRHILTPWGRSLVVRFERAADLPEGPCSWAVRINEQEAFCRPGTDGESGQTNSSVNALQINSTAAR